MTNDSIVRMTKAGFSEDFIVATIRRSHAVFDTSADGLIGLQKAGVLNHVVLAMVLKAASSVTSTAAQGPPPSNPSPQLGSNVARSFLSTPLAQQSVNKPRVFCEARSHGEGWNASRDQSLEMSKDFERNCPEVRLSHSQWMADYTVFLNHIEHGFVRDNQIRVADKDGDLLAKTKDSWSIKGDMKKACSLIVEDWAAKKVAMTSSQP